jgi:hypothetical protein
MADRICYTAGLASGTSRADAARNRRTQANLNRATRSLAALGRSLGAIGTTAAAAEEGFRRIAAASPSKEWLVERLRASNTTSA